MQKAELQHMNESDVRRAYRHWAPVYDAMFGRLVMAGMKEATGRANGYSGRLLEVGVGTGLALPLYGSQLSVTGIDLSTDMLARAKARVAKSGKLNIESLVEMDAGKMSFADEEFDIAVATFVLTVVPDPQRVVHELARVTKPGGIVLIVNHFSVETGLRGAIERGLEKHSTKLGWRPEFPIDTLLVSDKLRLTHLKAIKPMGFFSLLEFHRQK